MPEDIHPGSWVGDTTAEFKKLPTWGKFAAVGAVVLVAGIGWYEYNKAKSTGGTSVSSPGSTGTSLDPNAQMGGTQSPFAQVPTTAGNGASVPVIPFGDTPIFDALGNLIGWQQPGATAPGGGTTSTGTPATTDVPATGITPDHFPLSINRIPLVSNALKVWFGRGNVLYEGTDVKHQSVVKLPANTGVIAGSDGRYWLKESNGTQQLITNNFVRSAPSPTITKNKQTSAPTAKKVS
jgi:hypothetical protein